MTRALVVGLKRKGRKIGQAVRDVRRLLEGAGWRVDSGVVLRKRDLRRAAARGLKNGVDVVVAVGGDGAVLRVVNALAETEVALGIVPKGTGPGNAFRGQARKVTIKTSPRRLVEIDGSVVGRTPVTATIRHAALTVISPAR